MIKALFESDINLALNLFLAGFDKQEIDEIRRKFEEKTLKNASGLESKIKKCVGEFSDATQESLSDYKIKILI